MIVLDEYDLETIRVSVVLSTERIRANQIAALCAAMRIRKKKSSACCEILIVTFLFNTQLQFGSAAFGQFPLDIL